MKPILPNKFKTPENYFDDLALDILSQTTEKNKSKIIPLHQRNSFKIAMSVAASVLIIFMLMFFNSGNSITEQEKTQVQELVYEIYFEEIDEDEFEFDEQPILVEYVGLSNP